MSQVLINQFLGELDRLKKIGGTHRESVVSEAFKDLLKGWGKQHDLQFIPQYRLDSATKDIRTVDGALVYELRVPFGYWESKDAKDKLDDEIAYKFKRGYPQDNILFEDSTQAVLIQRRSEVMRCGFAEVGRLEKLLKQFFAFQRPEIADFRKAVLQFKADLPAVLEALRAMIELQHSGNAAFRKASVTFLEHAQEAINPGLTAADVREMLIQHILTEEIFSKVFDDSDFHRKNNVANELYRLEETFFTGTQTRAEGRQGHRRRRPRQRDHARRRAARCLALPAWQSLCDRLGARPVQREKTQGPDDPREVRHLPLCRLQGQGDRPAGPRDNRQRGDDENRRRDALGAAIGCAPSRTKSRSVVQHHTNV